jgi:hypothetical protein
MANILEFLRGVLTDAEIRGAFQADPTGFLERTGFGDLTGEDVAEAVAVVRRSLPESAAAALSAFEDDDELAAVLPQAGERELDAAARVLLYAVGQVPLPIAGREAPLQPQSQPQPQADAGPERRAERRSDRPQRPDRTEPEAAPGAALRPAADVAVPTLPSVGAFAETLTTILTETKARLTDVLRQAAQDADRVRSDAEAEVSQLRTDAAADREAAREYLERTRAESDAVLERSKEALTDAHRQREELIEASHAEIEAARREIDARRAELRDAERQLRERLNGIDALFRTVLRDDEAAAGGQGQPAPPNAG